MAIRIDWASDDKHILICHIDGQWGAAEFTQMLEQIHALTAEVEGMVDAICVFTNAAIPSGDLLPPDQPAPVKHTRTGCFVLVGLNRFMTPVTDAFRKLYAQGYRDYVTAATIEGAKGVIARRQKER
ncbi:MAG: hypothetical protein HXY40_12445 [Chloroflexi bacterium]|nr:hypothetical protein [Chloroflexota bacterium]